jgi:hypothetical protein
MVITVPQFSGPSGVRHVHVSLPLTPPLLDGEKYRLPDDVPAQESRDLRRIRYGRAPPTPRMTVRRLVLLAVARDAESEDRRLESRRGPRRGGSGRRQNGS